MRRDRPIGVDEESKQRLVLGAEIRVVFDQILAGIELRPGCDQRQGHVNRPDLFAPQWTDMSTFPTAPLTHPATRRMHSVIRATGGKSLCATARAASPMRNRASWEHCSGIEMSGPSAASQGCVIAGPISARIPARIGTSRVFRRIGSAIPRLL